MSESQATPGPTPVYADRETGEKFPDATSMVNAYLARFAERAGLRGEDGAPLVPVLDDGETVLLVRQYRGPIDRDLLEVVRRCETDTSTQLAWLKTRSKQAAPQALVVA